MQKSFTISTTKKHQMVDISKEVERIVKESKVKDGLCNVYCPHTTAGVFINENADSSVREDILDTLNKLIPDDFSYKHLEGNAAAHIKSVLVGSSINVPIKDNELELGRWQGVMFAEFDGPRERKVIVEILG